MAEVKKARLFLRRGTDTDRKLTTLCEGELGYSTDAFRVVVGDGITAGGLSLGATVFVSGGTLGSNFHTNLTTASANGLALSGDFAVFPAATYKKADGTTDSVPSASATNVMLLTGSDASVAGSWVAVNSGIPFGNIDIQNNDISGDYISGGTIEGPVSFSGDISATSTVSAASGSFGTLIGTGVRQVVTTATGLLSAIEPDDTAAIATGGTGVPVAMVTFGQQGSGSAPTLQYSMNTTSIACSASNVTANITALNGAGGIVIGTGQSPAYDYDNHNVIYYSNDQGSTALLGGIYKITFANALGSGYANRPVVITTTNYRGDAPLQSKKAYGGEAVTDYKFLSQTELLVVISAPKFQDWNSKNRGYLWRLYPSAGVPSNLTRFTVQVY